ncbi:MAG: hypothetical protein J6M94_05595 [Prevotella sp.]|nr:hypothetical protein [Prevotella sp.]
MKSPTQFFRSYIGTIVGAELRFRAQQRIGGDVGGDAIPELRSPTRSLSQRRNST